MRNEVFTNHSEAELLAMARSVGHKVAKKWPGSDPDDLAGAAILELYAKADYLFEKETPYLFTVLNRAAMAFASKERYDKIITTSQYVYTPREARGLLEEAYFNPVTWDVPTARDDPLSDTIGSGTIGISLMDMKTAMEKISPADKDILERRYYHNDGQAGDANERSQVSRAIDRLVKFMNYTKSQNESEGFEGRQAINNQKAQHQLGWYEGTDDSDEEYEQEDALAKIQREYNNFGLRPGEGYDFDRYKKETE